MRQNDARFVLNTSVKMLSFMLLFCIYIKLFIYIFIYTAKNDHRRDEKSKSRM